MFKSLFFMTVLFFDKTLSICSPGCNDNYIGDLNCDDKCNNIFCDYDGGDCLSEDNFIVNNEGSAESCNVTECSNIFFDDCNILQKYTNNWCNLDNDDSEYDMCCAKYQTDCCEYEPLSVSLASISFVILIICSCYGSFKILVDCCGD